jgi:chromosome segregation ATPase
MRIDIVRNTSTILGKQLTSIPGELGLVGAGTRRKTIRIELLDMPKGDDKCIQVVKQLEGILDADKKARELQEKKNLQQMELNKMKLKDIMKSKIKKTKEMLKELNGKELDVTTQLALIQNKQLITELEYQSKQVEKLVVRNTKLEDQISELRRELDIHKQVETELARQSQSLQKQLKNHKEIKVKEPASEIKIEKKEERTNDELIIFLEDKLEESEKKYATFQDDYETLHNNYIKQQKTIEKMKDKYSKAALLLVEFLDNLLNATPNLLQNEKNLYLDVERL